MDTSDHQSKSFFLSDVTSSILYNLDADITGGYDTVNTAYPHWDGSTD